VARRITSSSCSMVPEPTFATSARRLNSTVCPPLRPAGRRFPARRRLRACGWRAGQECVVIYPMTVAASGLGVQVGVGIVFGGTPQVVLRVPEQRSPLVLAQETGHPHHVVGRGQVSHAGVLRSGWPGCCARLARRGNARARPGFLRNWGIASSDLTEQRDVALQRLATVCWQSLPALSAAPVKSPCALAEP
jgi:hypothetical protein